MRVGSCTGLPDGVVLACITGPVPAWLNTRPNSGRDDPWPQNPGLIVDMSKIISPPQSGRVGSVVYVNSRYGQIVRQYVTPRNPKTELQQANRHNWGAVSSRWRGLDASQRIAWCIAAADSYTGSPAGRRGARNGYKHFIFVNDGRGR